MQRINSDHYLHNGYAIYQEIGTVYHGHKNISCGQRVWAVYGGLVKLFTVPFGQFDLIESIIDNLE